MHPGRPKGSQSGREKRHNKSFQSFKARAEVLDNVLQAFSPRLADCPWVSEDGLDKA